MNIELLDFEDIEKHARNKFEFFLLFLIIKPILFVLTALLFMTIACWAISGFGILFIFGCIGDGYYTAAIVVTVIDLILLVLYIVKVYLNSDVYKNLNTKK